MKSSLVLAAIAITSLTLSSCDNSSKSSDSATAQATASQFDNYFAAASPEGALPVGEARKAIAEGQKEVVVEGMLIANGPVFHPSAAMFFVCDDSKIKKEGAAGAPAAAGETCDCGEDHDHAGHDHNHADHGHNHADHNHGPKADAKEGAFDWCCTDPAVLKEALLSVQVVDASGKTIPVTIKGVNNMKEEAWVVIKGTPAPSSTKEAPLLNATQIYVVPAK